MGGMISAIVIRIMESTIISKLATSEISVF